MAWVSVVETAALIRREPAKAESRTVNRPNRSVGSSTHPIAFHLGLAVAAVPEVVSTLLFVELGQQTPAKIPELSTVRSAPSRNNFLNFANANSIGFRSGEYGGKVTQFRADTFDASRTLRLCDSTDIHHDNVARSQRWDQVLLDPAEKTVHR